MGVFWLILLALIVRLVVRLLPGSGDGRTRNTGESTLEILDPQLVSGQIDRESWQARRGALVAAQGDTK
jgi:uncharacterized membrane protein